MKILLALVATLTMALLAGCPATLNPVREAQTVEQKSYAVYGTFVIFEEIGAKVATDPSTSHAAKVAIAEADAKAKPVADSLLAAVKEVTAAEAQLKTGATTQDKVNIAIANLSTWLLQAQPLIQNLVTAVKGGS